MKVGMDAILLGSWIDTLGAQKILDIGTGCGIVALMLAQQSNATIDAIDIDMHSVEEASENFKNSPWTKRINAYNVSLQKFAKQPNRRYDLIVSNPPFYQNSLLPKRENLKLAKHNKALNYAELLNGSDCLLSEHGRLAIILPFNYSDQFILMAKNNNLFLQKQLRIYPTSSKTASRMILQFGRSQLGEFESDSIVIRNPDASYTKDYRQLTKAFHPEFS
jgi:tRNA1Val (adenine37-N6)-methyltransferase